MQKAAGLNALMTALLAGAAGGMPSEMQLLLDFYKSIGVVTYDARATARGLVMTTSMKLL